MSSEAGPYTPITLSLPVRLGEVELTAIRRALNGRDTDSSIPSILSRELSARAKAVALIKTRQQVERALRINLFVDPAWEILLDLFIKQIDGVPVSVTSACLASSAPQTTSLRYLSALVDRGVLQRRPCVTDRRVCFVQLSPTTFDNILAVLAERAA